MKIRNLHLLIIGAMFMFTSCQQERPSTKPVIRPLTESVYSSITIQPRDLYEVYASVGGILEEVYIDEGKEVKKGDLLFKIKNTGPKLNAENARLQLELARENYGGDAAILQEIKQEIAAAKLRLQNDSLLFFRQKTLWDQQIGSKNEYDAREMAYEVAQTTVDNLRNKLSRTRKELSKQVQLAENTYRNALVNTGDFTVSSLESGTVYEVYKEVGEIVNQQQPVAMIGASDQFVIDMRIDEVDIVKVKAGQKVIVTLDAYGTETFEAKVTKIYPRKDDRNQTFLVEAEFTAPPGVLYAGLSGEANIIIEQKEVAMIVPYAYLIDKKFVQTKDGKKPIKTGLFNMEYVEIIEGLDTSTVIYLPEEI